MFFALWPDEALRAGLAKRAREAQAECGGRSIAGPNIHLTLVFVGALERERLPELERVADEVRSPGLEFGIDTLGYWRHNRIVWAGSGAVSPLLVRLVQALGAAVASLGIKVEARPYVPHVTLVRNAEKPPAMRAFPSLAWLAREFVLVESVPAGAGVRYEVRRSWPLRPL